MWLEAGKTRSLTDSFLVLGGNGRFSESTVRDNCFLHKSWAKEVKLSLGNMSVGYIGNWITTEVNRI